MLRLNANRGLSYFTGSFALVSSVLLAQATAYDLERQAEGLSDILGGFNYHSIGSFVMGLVVGFEARHILTNHDGPKSSGDAI